MEALIAIIIVIGMAIGGFVCMSIFYALLVWIIKIIGDLE